MKYVEFSVQGDIGGGKVQILTACPDSESLTKNEDGGSKSCSPNEILVKQSFALKYLNLFTKAGSLSNEVTIQMSQDSPIVLEYEMDDNLGKLMYYLAPKINDADDGEGKGSE